MRAKPEHTCNPVGLGAAVLFFSVFLIYLGGNRALIEKSSLDHCFRVVRVCLKTLFCRDKMRDNVELFAVQVNSQLVILDAVNQLHRWFRKVLPTGDINSCIRMENINDLSQSIKPPGQNIFHKSHKST